MVWIMITNNNEIADWTGLGDVRALPIGQDYDMLEHC